MNEIYANAYQEVIEVLKYTKKEDLIKIPKFKIDMYKKYMNKNNGFKIDKTKSLEEQDISNEAKAILANLYKDYWATDYEKRRIEAKENYDLEQIAKEKYSADNLFRKREVKTETISHNENSMIIVKEEKWYKKIFNGIKNFFSKKNNDKLSVEEINQIEKQKSDGEPYARMFDNEYSKMTKEEKEETDKIMNELDEIIGLDDDLNEGNNTYSQISYEEYKKAFEKDKEGCFINLIIPRDEQNEELNLIGKNPSEFSIDEIVRMKKYSEQLYKKVDKNTINEYYNDESVKQSKTNLPELKRTELVDLINDKFNWRSDDISKFTISIIDNIVNMMENYSYKSDNRFYTFGRREFLEKEIKEYLGNNNVLDAYIDFYEYVDADNLWISFSDIPTSMNPQIVIKEHEEYKNEGIICEQEKNEIIDILTRFKNRFYNTSINNNSISIDEESLKRYAPILVDEEIGVDIERACDILKESCEICNITEIKQVKRLAKISPNSEGESIEITDNIGEKYYVGIGGYGFIEIIRKHSIDGKIIFVPIED